MTPTKTAAILVRLADDWRHEEAQLCKQFGDVVLPQSMRARRIKDTEAIDAALEMIDRLEAAEKLNEKLREALAEKVASETMLRDLSVGNGHINASFEGGAVHLLVDALANQFVESSATNYLEMQFHSNVAGPLVVTLQRLNGRTPHQLRAEAEKECDALRAKIEQMEKQGPVAFALYSGWSFKAAYHKEHEACDQRDRRQLSADLGGSLEAYRVVPLYALPGAQAQPAPSINEGVRNVTLDFRWESEAQHHIPTIEIEFEPVSPESPNDAKSWQDRDRLAAMLTPEAKP